MLAFLLENVHDLRKPAPRLLREAGRQEGRRADFSYCFLLHTRPMILFTGAGRPVSGMYFAQAQCGIWQCPRPRGRDCFHWWCGPACWQVSQNGMVIRVRLFPVIRQGVILTGPPVGMKVFMRCALRRAALGEILSCLPF